MDFRSEEVCHLPLIVPTEAIMTSTPKHRASTNAAQVDDFSAMVDLDASEKDGLEHSATELQGPHLGALATKTSPGQACITRSKYETKRVSKMEESQSDNAETGASCSSPIITAFQVSSPAPPLAPSTVVVAAKPDVPSSMSKSNTDSDSRVGTIADDMLDQILGAETYFPSEVMAESETKAPSFEDGFNANPAATVAFDQTFPLAYKAAHKSSHQSADPHIPSSNGPGALWSSQPISSPRSETVVPQASLTIGMPPPSQSEDGAAHSIQVTEDRWSSSSNADTPRTPIQQLGRALASLRSEKDGSSEITIQLDPDDLGSLRIHIARSHDGTASVSVAAEKLETLRALQADMGSLHHALDRAGLSDQRSVTLHLAAAEVKIANLSASPQDTSDGNFQRGEPRQSRHAPGSKVATRPDEQMERMSDEVAPLRWFHASVNITA